MSKKLIIMVLGLGALSFAGAFAFAWFTKPSPVKTPEPPEQSTKTIEEIEQKPRRAVTNMIAEMDSASVDQTRSIISGMTTRWPFLILVLAELRAVDEM